MKNNLLTISGIILFLSFLPVQSLSATDKTKEHAKPEVSSPKKNDSYKEIKTGLKTGVRSFFENMSKNLPKEDFGVLPEGLKIIEGEAFRGIKVSHGFLEFRVHTWLEDGGLLDSYNKCKSDGENIIAAVNGTFYSERGVLGQVISDGKIPRVRQIPGRLSRSFLCAYRGAKNVQFWYLGETALSSSELMLPHHKDMIWFNGSADSSIRCDNLIGGGGWILRNRKDAHNEAVDRQFFRFRPEDRASRKTVVAQDSNRDLYFLVFEAGFTLHQVARAFVSNEIFKEVQDAIFLDGGSSSCIVVKGKYLVSPLYLVDKARFSCIQILKPEIIW